MVDIKFCGRENREYNSHAAVKMTEFYLLGIDNTCVLKLIPPSFSNLNSETKALTSRPHKKPSGNSPCEHRKHYGSHIFRKPKFRPERLVIIPKDQNILEILRLLEHSEKDTLSQDIVLVG